MKALDRLRKQIGSAEDLLGVVRMMKTLASVNIHKFEQAVGAIEAYREGVELGVQMLMFEHPELLESAQRAPESQVILLAFGSDQGLCGPLNEKAAERSDAQLHRLVEQDRLGALFVIGYRLARSLEARGWTIDQELRPQPSSLAGVDRLLEQLFETLIAPLHEQNPPIVEVVYCLARSGQALLPMHRRLLPLDRQWLKKLAERPWRHRRLPGLLQPSQMLFSTLIEEMLYVRLVQVCVEAMAAENASRLAAMQAAQSSIDERLSGLKNNLRSARQEAVSDELADIVSGWEATKSHDR